MLAAIPSTETPMASINGIAHIQLTVSDMARSTPFYEKLLHSLEMVTLSRTRSTSTASAAAPASPSPRPILR